jgi:hypothetical protein
VQLQQTGTTYVGTTQGLGGVFVFGGKLRWVNQWLNAAKRNETTGVCADAFRRIRRFSGETAGGMEQRDKQGFSFLRLFAQEWKCLLWVHEVAW